MASISEALAITAKHIQAGRLQQAELLCQDILRVNAQHPGALHNLGLIALQVGKNDDAIRLLRRAIMLNPEAAEFHNSLGAAYGAISKVDEAFASYQRALRLKPNYTAAEKNLGQVLKTEGIQDEAMTGFQQAFADAANATPAKKLIVVSHERSGTHFLMNTLALNFGYIASPWINFDFDSGLNFHSAKALTSFFKKMRDKTILRIVKSHHTVEFFQDLFDCLSDQFLVFYIYRDPRDVMVSFWRFINELPWDEGPKTATLSEFMRAGPRGGLLRYQKEQVPTMLDRWKNHVENWCRFAQQNQGNCLHCLRYEDLNLRFDETVKQISDLISQPVLTPTKPRVDVNVVIPGSGKVGHHQELFSAEDYDFVRETVGDTMEWLGIAWDAES